MPKSNLANRTRYDLSSYQFMVGNLGQLQTRQIVNVVAGDSFKIDTGGVFSLSTLRTKAILDVLIEEFIFFVPYRHVYGSSWTDFIIAGQDEGTSFTTRTLLGSTEFLGTKTIAGQVVPLWLTQNYINIFNRYFKHPSVADTAASYFDAIADGDTQLEYGMRCGFLKQVWNSAVDADVTAADYRFALVDTDKIDLLSLASTKGLLKSERRREFYAHRYNEIIYAQWGANVNTDADQRPELIFHKKSWLGAHDVMGTDDASLGKYSGVAKGLSGMSVPRKFFNEHGVLHFMVLLRLPAVHELEINYLANKSQPDYATIAGDPEIFKVRAPVTLNLAEYILGSALSDAGIVPFGQWYRETRNRVHGKLSAAEVSGHPFASGTFSTAADLKYMPVSMFEPMFATAELAQWQLNGRIQIIADRVIPEVSTSVFAGTN